MSSARRKAKQSNWESVLEAAQRAPELLFACETTRRVYFLPVDLESYDLLFEELGLPCWRSAFRLQNAVEG